MVAFRYKHVCIESYSAVTPPNEVSSAEIEDRLSPLFKRLEIPFGTLEKLSGIKSRCFWDRSVFPSQAGTEAARAAVEAIGFPREKLQALFSCSVTRDYFEPATASLIHGNLQLGENAMTMDISNACIGFSNGMLTLANMIEAGIVQAGVIVSAEQVASIIDSSMDYLLRSEDITRERLLKILPTFTLGSGAASMVLCHESLSRKGHYLRASEAFSASQHSDLCVGNADYCAAQGMGLNPIMETDSQKIIASAAKLGGRVWPSISKTLEWSAGDIDHIFCHQVGRQLNTAFFREMGLSNEKEFIVYPRFGNQVSAALPTAFITGISEKSLKSGEKVLLTAFGSGLNAIFTGIEW